MFSTQEIKRRKTHKTLQYIIAFNFPKYKETEIPEKTNNNSHQKPEQKNDCKPELINGKGGKERKIRRKSIQLWNENSLRIQLRAFNEQ